MLHPTRPRDSGTKNIFDDYPVQPLLASGVLDTEYSLLSMVCVFFGYTVGNGVGLVFEDWEIEIDVDYVLT